ncbi:hypothetical protein CQW23_21758 [Capsicum baccatum]|uniref:Uncharacterized protein n=1 Tax=Capsicum baccatum TaxID=33114 RepID=A0A2G2VYY3_CAPBA|nr:hypothetical protein CQW23_21758 [Capsicum baccatum]
MLPLHPGLYELKDDDAALPYATRWIRGIERNTESHHTLIAIRDQIDHMKEVQDRHGKLVVPVHGDVLRDYALWFLQNGRLLIGNPTIKDIPDMAGLYSIRPIKLPSHPVDGKPRRDMEAVCLSYRSSIGDGYILDKAGLSGTQNIGQTFTQHTAFADKTNSLFGNTNEIFDLLTSGRSLESLLGYARPTSSGFHLLDKGTAQGGRTPSQEKIVPVQAAGGIIAGATASFITTPLDNIKT